ncbi:MAG: HD domain-containing protein [Candidatus Wallbacteria bacterium]|nr:HD domain-containing protein [Candidatus Wallbacteria bacterium]
MDKLIIHTESLVRDLLAGEATGHDWHHADRVRKMALKIAASEGACDLPVVELASLVHDLCDPKISLSEGKCFDAEQWFSGLGLAQDRTAHIISIIDSLSFHGAGVATPMATIEGKIVQDADRLDAIGAIGIARTFAYGGKKGQPLHDPDLRPVQHESYEQYRSQKSTSINHFHEKLLLLKDRLNTESAKKIAADRHAFLEEFLQRFQSEWDCRG